LPFFASNESVVAGERSVLSFSFRPAVTMVFFVKHWYDEKTVRRFLIDSVSCAVSRVRYFSEINAARKHEKEAWAIGSLLAVNKFANADESSNKIMGTYVNYGGYIGGSYGWLSS
jgi:hypothetical protein